MKRMIRNAAEHGFDPISFPATAEQVAEIEGRGRNRPDPDRRALPHRSAVWQSASRHRVVGENGVLLANR